MPAGRKEMPAYITLINFTDHGARDISLIAQRVRRMQNDGSIGEVKLLAWYLTMGGHDAVAIAEAPDDQAMMRGLLQVAAEGDIRTETLRAFPLEEFEHLVSSLP
jgi:uncharacterized protein with GYD domain